MRNPSVTQIDTSDKGFDDQDAIKMGEGLRFVLHIIPIFCLWSRNFFFMKRHFFDGATRCFVVDNGHYQGFILLFCQPKHLVDEIRALRQPIFFFRTPRHPIFFFTDNGHYQGVFEFYLQPKQDVASTAPFIEQDWCCWRCLNRWCLGVRHCYTLWMQFPSKRHFFCATHFFRMIMGHYQGVFLSDSQPKRVSDGIGSRMEHNWRCWSLWPWCWPCVRLILSLWMTVHSNATPPDFFMIRALSRGVYVWFAAKTTRWRNCTCAATRLAMLALPRSVVPWRTSLFHLVNDFLSYRYFFGATRFFRIEKGIINVYLCLFCSRNTSLTILQLSRNQFGDVGASGLGTGLAYVSFCLCGWTPRQPTFSDDNGHYQGVFVSDLQPK